MALKNYRICHLKNWFSKKRIRRVKKQWKLRLRLIKYTVLESFRLFWCLNIEFSRKNKISITIYIIKKKWKDILWWETKMALSLLQQSILDWLFCDQTFIHQTSRIYRKRKGWAPWTFHISKFQGLKKY